MADIDTEKLIDNIQTKFKMDIPCLKSMIDQKKKALTSDIKKASEFLESFNKFMEVIDNFISNDEFSLENMYIVLTKMNDFSFYIYQACIILAKSGIWSDNTNRDNISKWFHENFQINSSNSSLELRVKVEEQKSCIIESNLDTEQKEFKPSKQTDVATTKQNTEDRNFDSAKKCNLLDSKIYPPMYFIPQFKHVKTLQKAAVKNEGASSFESQCKVEDHNNKLKSNLNITSKEFNLCKQISEVTIKQSTVDKNLKSDDKLNLSESKLFAPIELKIKFEHDKILKKSPLKNKEALQDCRVSLPKQHEWTLKDEFTCIITHVNSPESFYVNPDFYSKLYNEIISTLRNLNTSNKFKSKKEILDANVEYFVVEVNQDFYRATLSDLLHNSKNELLFFLIDVGSKLCIDYKAVFSLPFELYDYPPLAYYCFLDIVKPLPKNKGLWSLDAIKYLKKYLYKKCFANISKITDSQLGLMLINEENMVINMELEFEGLATLDSKNGDENIKNKSIEKNDVSNVNDSIKNNDVPEGLKNFQINYENEDDDSFFDDEDVPVDVEIRFPGGDYKDEMLICPFYKGPPDTTCFKGLSCKKLHQSYNPNGWTIEKEKLLTIKEHNLPSQGDILNISVTTVVNFRRFYAHIIPAQKNDGDHTSINQELKTLETPYMAEISSVLNSSVLQELTHYPAIGEYVATNISGFWYRAQVVHILDRKTARVFLIDYGHINDVDLKHLRKLDVKHTTIPKLAVEFEIENINLKNYDNLLDAQNALCETTFKKRLIAIVKSIQDTTVIITAYNDDGYDISELLWACGYIEIFDPVSNKTETDDDESDNINTIYIPG